MLYKGWLRSRIVGTAATLASFSLLVAGTAVAASVTGFTPVAGTENIANACIGTQITITGVGFAQDAQGAPVRPSRV